MTTNRIPLTSVDDMLANLGEGLSVEVLQDTVAKGEIARHRAHKYDPKGAAGNNAHQLRIRTLRIRLVEFGWTVLDELNCAMVVNPDGDKRIVIGRGDEFTGLPPVPSTYYKKGKVWQRAVAGNQLSLPGFEPLAPAIENLETNETAMETWALLVWNSDPRYENGKKYVDVRYEMSLPNAWENARPTDWKWRIIPPMFTLEFDDDSYDSIGPPPDEPPGGSGTAGALPGASDDDLDVPLERKKE